MTELAEIETPVALVDVDRMRANLERVAAYAKGAGLAWRPHAKTHKVAALGAEQIRAGAVGLTIATTSEAEVMAGVTNDLLFAYPSVGAPRLQRLMALPERVRLSVSVDSAEPIEELSVAAESAGREVGVLVELDLGMRRVGVGTVADAIALARRIVERRQLRYDGIIFYPGQIRAPIDQQGGALEEVSQRLEGYLNGLAAAQLTPRVVSGGSTPTLWRSHEIVGLTEIRPGINIFNDRTVAAIGACAWSDCAYSVLATVVSTAVPGQAVIDAGSKSLAKEDVPGLVGYGAVLDRPDLVVTGLSEEHGIIDLTPGGWRPRVGERVRVVPNHVCVSVNLQEVLLGVRHGAIVESWAVAGRRRFAAS